MIARGEVKLFWQVTRSGGGGGGGGSLSCGRTVQGIGKNPNVCCTC